MVHPFDPLALFLVALLNPVVAIVAFLMGRKADQWQKVPIAAFAGALAGAVALWVAAFLQVVMVHGMGGEGGIFVASFFVGLVWATIGYALRPRGAS